MIPVSCVAWCRGAEFFLLEAMGRDDVLGELDWDLCKLKMGNGPKDLEKTIDMNWMRCVKGATLYTSPCTTRAAGASSAARDATSAPLCRVLRLDASRARRTRDK